MMTESEQDHNAANRDKLGVFVLCGLALAIIGGISMGAIMQRIPNDSQTLLGVIVGGIMIFARECLVVIRQFWSDAKTAKLTDALANSGPQITPIMDEVPEDAKQAAELTADAARDKADEFRGK